MNRLLVVTTGALLLCATACGNTEEEPKLECQLESFDLSACDRSGFASVSADGIWHANVTLDGVGSPGSMRLLPEGSLLFGNPLTERQVEGDTFFLASDYRNASNVPLRLAIAGCQALSPDRVKGEFRRCVRGAVDLKGTFEAVRVKRVEGEQEASGVKLVSEIALPRGVAMDVFVAGGYAYVTALSDGLFVFDVRNPAAPRKVAELTPSNDVWSRAWVKDQTLYISSNREGVLVYNVSNPEAPRRLRAVPSTRIQALGLYVDQNRLYVMSPSPLAEVLIFDITRPEEPSLLSRYYVKETVVELGETPVDGVVLNNRLYISHWRYGLAVANVTDPSQPEPLGHFVYDNAASRPVAVGLIGDRTIAFEASENWGSRVRALDVSNPEHITEVGRFEMRPESMVSGLALVGSRLYVAHTQDGLRIVDMSNPSTPRQLAYYNTWRETDAGRGRAFIDGLSGVEVPGNGFIYATETSRGLLVFQEQ